MNGHRLDREAENFTGSIEVMDSLDDTIRIYPNSDGKDQSAEIWAALDEAGRTGQDVRFMPAPKTVEQGDGR